MKLFRIIAIGLLMLSACASLAKPPFLKVFLSTYKIDPNSELGKARCQACHMPPAPPQRNSYGLQVQTQMEASHERMITPELLHLIEKKDADGDGVINLDEIKAGMLPGDSKSKPIPKPKPKPKTKTRQKAKQRAKRKNTKRIVMNGVDTVGGLIFFAAPALGLGVFRGTHRTRQTYSSASELRSFQPENAMVYVKSS